MTTITSDCGLPPHMFNVIKGPVEQNSAKVTMDCIAVLAGLLMASPFLLILASPFLVTY